MSDDPLTGGAGRQSDLADLRWHWDSAYEINCSGGTWTARFLDETAVLSAASADDLRLLIRADYMSRKLVTKPGAASSRRSETDVGAGERALRRLRDEGVI